MPTLARFVELSLAAQTAYAELLHAATAVELHRGVAHLNGSFASKQVKRRKYWYFAYRDVDGALRQLYVGPDGARVQRLMERFREDAPADLAPMARAASTLGGEAVLPRHFRVIRRLSEYGFFRAGGVLIGTHAFVCLGNVLGVRFANASRTLDVDFAHAGRNIAIALPASIRVEVHKAIESLEMGFLPLAEYSGAAGAGYLNPRSPELRLDFLTPSARGSRVPVRAANLDVPLQPLPYMEFLLQDTIQAVLFCDEGAVVVNVPAPARFAVHKLIVHGERKGALRVKARKDLVQAASLVECLASRTPAELADAWADALSRGPAWTRRAEQGRAALARFEPPVDGLVRLDPPRRRKQSGP